MTEEELNLLIIAYGKHLFSFCCNLSGNKSEAEDLYQDTLLKAVELRHKLDSSGNPKSFLMGIAVKIWQNHKKKYAVRQKIVQLEELNENFVQYEDGTSQQPEEKVILDETIITVRREVKRLPEKLQIIIYMYYTAEMSVEDIGRALHIPNGTVKSRLYKGRILLKELLEVHYYGS